MVKRDPCLAFELFTNVNRDLKHAGRSHATNIRRAVLVFGVARYLEQAKRYVSLENFIDPRFLRPALNHLGRTCIAGHLAETLAQLRGGMNPEEAFCLALSRDFDNYANYLIEASNVAIDIRNTRTLMPGLALPAIKGDPVQWCAEEAVKFSHACQFGWDENVLLPQIDAIAKQLNRESTTVHEALRTAVITGSHNTKHFNDYPSAYFLMNPGPAKPIKAMLFPSPKQSPVQPLKSTQGLTKRRPLIKQSGDEQAKPQAATPTDTKQFARLSAAVDKAITDLKKLGGNKQTRTRILPYALTVFVKVLKADKALFIAHPADQQLIARLQISADKSPSVAKLPIELDDNPVLRKVLVSAKSRHITKRQMHLHEQLFDKTLSKFLGENEVYCLPLANSNKVIGILLARFKSETTDRWPQHFQLAQSMSAPIIEGLNRSID